MHFFIEKLKISNFLSFFGESEVNLKPLTAVMCNYDEGKADFLKALEFVFGAEISENPLNLVHKVLREEFLVSRDIQSYVEASVNLVEEKKRLTFCRCVKRGMSLSRVEHKISGIITTRLNYEEKLNSLNLDVKRKNLIFYNSHFVKCVWGSSEDLEMTINNCLRNDYLLEEWKRARKEVKYWTNLNERASENNSRSIKRNHFAVEKLATDFEAISAKRETIREQHIKNVINPIEINVISPMDATEEEEEEKIRLTQIKSIEKMMRINDLESKCDSLTDKLNNLKLKSAVLTSRLHQNIIKLAIKPENSNALKNRLRELKSEARKKNNQLIEILENIDEMNADLEIISEKISSNLILRNEIQLTSNLQNRFTKYGRLVDYLQPSRHVQLLQRIIGNDLFYANLCDSMENALSSIDLMKILNYDRREMFVIFENYSHHLKDVLTASGENGIQIDSLERLLIFLSKLAHYGLIDEVPVMVNRKFDYDNEIPPTNNYVVYIQSDLYFTSEGFISYKSECNTFCVEEEDELEKKFIQLKTEEEIKYQQLRDKIFSRFKILSDKIQLENDIFYLEQNLEQKSIRKEVWTRKVTLSPPEIYNEFKEIFNRCEEEWTKCEKEIQQLEDSFLGQFLRVETFTEMPSEDSTSLILTELKEVLEEKKNSRRLLEDANMRLRILSVPPIYNYKFKKFFIRFDNLDTSKLFFEKEFRKLKKIIDLEEFMGCQEWKKSFITFLFKNLKEIREKLKVSNEAFKTICVKRRNQLYSFIEHCSHFLNDTFQHLLDKALPSVHLCLSSDEETLQMISSLEEDQINFVDIKHFNTFLRFISVLSMFLELAVFEQIPLMIFEEVEEFFPRQNDNLEAVLDQRVIERITPENKNIRFHLLMRIGQFFSYYIKENTGGKRTGNIEDSKAGPMQIIYFAKEDLIHAAGHQIWIQSQALPDRFAGEDCDSYSEIHEIKFSEQF